MVRRTFETIQNGQFKTGELLLLSSGEYSDYSVHTLVRVLKDFDANDLRREFIQAYPNQEEAYNASEYGFISYLILRAKVCEEISYREFYIGAYSSLSEMAVKNPLEDDWGFIRASEKHLKELEAKEENEQQD